MVAGANDSGISLCKSIHLAIQYTSQFNTPRNLFEMPVIVWLGPHRELGSKHGHLN
ncbi:hypothetical protein RMSM_03430 [Rhodopirellula maiorica SM1]|uniref:Uncharacterized protein n=1 Tax=Rhodopirellula maiorica SM1 TaxID=1265738 RepID=M5RK06_9BACT|nr:hypothetical protein RMSM_03430 [Rhodopirellula maiorica SM1]